MLAAYKNLVWTIVKLVNAPRGYTYTQQRDMLLLKPEQRSEFIDAAKSVVARQLALGALGELSWRLSTHQMAITGQNCNLAYLTKTDIVICSALADNSSQAAARYVDWHRLIYRRTAAQSVLLCHPKHAFILANASWLPLPDITPEISKMIGEVALLRPDDLSEANLPEFASKCNAILIPQTGALVWGDSLANAIDRAEALEYLSQLTTIAHQSELFHKSVNSQNFSSG